MSEEIPELCVAMFVGEAAKAGSGEELARVVAEALQPSTGAVRTLYALQQLLPGLAAALKAGVASTEEPQQTATNVDSSMVVLSQLAAKVPEQEESAAVKAYCDAVAGGEGETSLRLKGLFHLHNALPRASGRQATFVRIMSYAVAAKVPEAALPAARRVESLVGEWKKAGLAAPALRESYLAASDLFRAVPSAREASGCLVKYLGTFSDADASDAGAQAAAVRAVTDFVGSPDTFSSDLADLPAVAALGKSPKHAPVHKLLEVLLSGTLAEYKAWEKAHAAALKELGLSGEALESKMRLLSLAALAKEKEGEVSYARVSEVLRVDAAEVEAWVVRAISAKLVEAKMDQLREVVQVTRCVERVFGKEQWEELRAKLGQWEESIAAVQKTVKQVAKPPVALKGMPAGLTPA